MYPTPRVLYFVQFWPLKKLLRPTLTTPYTLALFIYSFLCTNYCYNLHSTQRVYHNVIHNNNVEFLF